MLDGLPLTVALVVDRVTHGKGAMPPFAQRIRPRFHFASNFFSNSLTRSCNRRNSRQRK